jgi:hypothetical protein
MARRRWYLGILSCLALASAGLLTGASTAAATPTTALTVRQNGGWDAQNSTLYIRIATAGHSKGHELTPALQYLADPSGLDAARVKLAASCAQHPIRRTTKGSSIWCLKIIGVDPGSDLTGTIKGKGASFKLTVSVRDGLGLPIIIDSVGLLVGIFLAWLTTDLLPRAISSQPPLPDSSNWRKLVPEHADQRLRALRVVTVAAVVATAAVAGAATLSTVYGGNNSFGTGWDYLALATSAAGSSAIAGIAASLLLLVSKRPTPATPAGGDDA